MTFHQSGPTFCTEGLCIHHGAKCQKIQPLFDVFKMTYDTGRFPLTTQSRWMVAESLNKRGG